MSLATSNRDGGKTSESGHLRAIQKVISGEVLTGLNVSQRGAGANMSVDVAIGDAVIPRSDGTYGHPAWADAIYNVAITTADVSNPRRDIVVMYIDYGNAVSTAVSNNTNGVVKIIVVAGTPAGSPTDPSNATIQAAVGSGNPYIKLGRVRVGAGVTTIGNSVIDDLRVMATGLANGGWTGIPNSEVAGWSFSSWNATTRIGVITVPTDATTRYTPGMRVRFVQATGGTKYGIIHYVTATALHVFFPAGTTFNNEALIAPVFSSLQTPFGFNRDTANWSLESILTSDATIAGPVFGTWYNPNSHAVTFGPGVWRLYAKHTHGADRAAAGRVDHSHSISTSPSAESHPAYTGGGAASNTTFISSTSTIRDTIAVTTTTTLYEIIRASGGGGGITNLFSFGSGGTAGGSRVLRVISAYL